VSTTVDRIVATLRSVLRPEGDAFVALHEPLFEGNEWTYVKECIDMGWVSSAGKYVDRFEADVAGYTGARRAVAVVNGTAALHVALLLAGVERGDEVIVPALTFVATANAVAYCGAVNHFVDSEECTLGLDPYKLAEYLAKIAVVKGGVCRNQQTGRVIRAVVPMHTFGHPVDLDPLAEVCERFEIVIVEDAAESLGSYYKGRHTGRWGRLSTLSFNGNKVVTTGGGGAILTDDDTLADRAKHLTTTGKRPHRWAYEHDTVAFNYRLPNLNAALGCAQLEQLDRFLAEKRCLAEHYAEAFEGLEGVRFVTEPPFARSNYWLNAVLLNETHAGERDRLLEASNDDGIMTRPVWTLMSALPMYRACPRMDLRVAESIERRLVSIPSSAALVPSKNHRSRTVAL
jgi:perosamine synthetase